MKRYSYKKVDAFTSGKSMGNPAAYIVTGKDKLTDNEYLKIGKEHAGFVSEVVFCSDSKVADCKLTYYSSECEVDFCGHGTIATMYELIKGNESWRDRDKISIETNKKGVLTVYNNLKSEDSIYITAPKALFFNCNISKDRIAQALNISSDDISDKYDIDLIDAGLRTLIVPINSLEREIKIYPDEKFLKQFVLDNDIDIILIYSMECSQPDYFAHTRVFAPKFGYLEDPATGSGNSAFANYLLKHNLWDGSPISVEQGGDNIIFNAVKLKTNGLEVLFGGKATVRIEGVYLL